MTVKIAIMLIFAAAFVFALMYFKRKKGLDTPINLKNSDIQPNINKVESQKVNTTKSDTTPTIENTAQPTVLEAEGNSGILGEAILKRHHLSNIRQMVIATTFPQPTDSVLSRHYDEMIDAKAEDCLADETKMARLVAEYGAYLNLEFSPETSPTEDNSTKAFDEEHMLKRHYLNHARLMVVATTFPRPTDSVLSRHYDEMIDAKAEECLADEAKMARLIADYEATQSVEESEVFAQIGSQATVAGQSQTAIPEDSMLRRHYLTNLQASLEKIR